MIIDYKPWAERSPEEKAAFTEKLQYWQKHGVPGFKSDETDAFQSHADGKMYTSKSEYRKNLRAQGFEEKGDSRNTVSTPKADDSELIADIKHVMGEL